MERKKSVMIAFLLMTLMTAGGVSAPAPSYREAIYKAYVDGKMGEWKSIIDKMESAPKKEHSRLLELVNYQYGYIGYTIGRSDKQTAALYLAQAEKNLEILEKAKYQPSMTHAYRAAFYGFRIGLNTSSAPFNGLRSLRASSMAVSADAQNWFAQVQKANIQFYMPPVFGGSKKEALGHLLKAQALMEKNKALVTGNWNYLSLLTLIVQTYETLGDLPAAKRYCELILAVAPEYSWVRDGLYPGILKKIKTQE